ncbi:hypothetical protein BHU09_07980 [Tannerella sp. oral taxon 808]|nr:hypothetical protein BHU09_07980 [Tannerella sp. oral taxon 808]
MTLKITSDGGKLPLNKELEFHLKVKAGTCPTPASVSFGINVLSSSTPLGSKTILANLVRPSLMLTPQTPVVNFTSQTETKTITYYLKTTTADKASSAKVTFTTPDAQTTLSDFKVKGTPVSVTGTPIGGGKTKYTFDVTPATLGGAQQIDNTNSTAITFTGASTGVGGHTVTTAVQFPAGSAPCTSNPGSPVQLAFPIPTKPYIEHLHTYCTDPLGDSIHHSTINMDGSTPTIVRSSFRNTGGTAKGIIVDMRCYGNYNYLDPAGIKVQVGGSGTSRFLAASEYTVLDRIKNSTYTLQRYGRRKLGVVNKPISIKIKIADTLATGDSIIFWVPTINGNIYETGNLNVYNAYGVNGINGFVSNVVKVTAPDGTEGGHEKEKEYRLVYLNVPHYWAIPAGLNMRGGTTKTQTLHVSPGITQFTPVYFAVETPSWLKIKRIWITSNENGTGSLYVNQTCAPGTTKDSVKLHNKGYLLNSYMHVTYEMDACSPPYANINDSIRYWTSQHWPQGWFYYASQVFQPVTKMCRIEGIELDTFKLVRTTVGLKDHNNDRIPDDGTTKAPESDIRNDLYMEGDTGYFYWKGIVQSEGVGAHYVDMPLALATGLDFLHNIHMETSGSATINSVPAAGTVIAQSNSTTGYVRFHYPTGFSLNDTVEVKAPFIVQKGNENMVGVETEMYINLSSSPGGVLDTSNANRSGKDKAATAMGTYSIDYLNYWYTDPFTYVFGDNSVTSFMPPSNRSLGYNDIFHKNSLSDPQFPREVRVHYYLDTVEFDMPKGYRLLDQIDVKETRYPAPPNGTLGAISIQPTSSSTKTQRIYAISPIYTNATNVSPLSVGGGQWYYPDDAWRVTTYGKIQAYPSAPRTAVYMKRRAVWRSPSGKTFDRELNVKFTYSGLGNTLSIDPYTVTAPGPYMKTPNLQVANSTSKPIPHLYFYFDGPVKDVKLENSGTHVVYNGQGLGNRWVKVDSSIVGSLTYQMIYTYLFDSTLTNCSKVDTVRVYTGFGTNANWPDFTKPMNLDSANFSAADTFYITIDPTAKVKGYIEAKKDTFPAYDQHVHHLDSTYTVYAIFEAEKTAGAVKNPSMDFSVPAYQRYIPWSAKLHHAGQVLSVTPAFESALQSSFGSSINTVQTGLLDLKIARGGNILIAGGNDTPDSLRRDTLEMTFAADCETDFERIYYKGEIHGFNSCSGAKAGGDGVSFNKKLIPNVIYNYRFGKVGIEMLGMPAFNEFRTRDTLQLTFRKIVGTANNMAPSDYLMVRLPQDLDVDGDSVYYRGTGVMAALNRRDSVIAHDSIADHGRYVKIPLPKTEYDAATDKGVGANISCKIPVIYTRPTGADSIYRLAHAADSIKAYVRINGLFGDCPPRLTLDGLNKDSIAMITARGPFPPRLYVGEEDTLEILSHNFGGSWYTDSTTSTVEYTGPKWPQTPRDTSMLGEEKYYFTAVVNGHYYGGPNGRLPFPVKIWIHPWFIKNLPRFKYICEEEDTLRVKGGGMDIRYQWFRNEIAIPGATDTTLVVRESGFYYVQITDTVPETVTSDTCEVVFREIPVILEDLKDIRDCDKIYIPLAVKHTGRYMLYQWYRNGRPIKGATDSIYRASAYDSSGFYRVRVMNPCGDSVMSRRCYVDFCDDRWDGPARVVDLYAPATVETQPGTVRNVIPSHTDFNFTIRARKGQSLRYITITASHPNWTEQGGGIERTMITDSLMQVRVRRVTQNLEIRVGGVSPTGNDLVDDASRHAWTHHGRLYLRTDRAQSVRLYTPMGLLYREQSLPAGLTVVSDLPTGIYLVRFADGHVAKVRVE